MLLVYPLGLGTENPFFVLLLASFFFPSPIHQKTDCLPPSALRSLPRSHRSHPLRHPALCDLPPSASCFHSASKTRASYAILAFVLVLTPWIIRNSLLHHKLTGIETSMGYNLYLGYHPQGNGSFVFGPSLDLLTILDDAERDRIGTEKAIEFIKAQPERFIPLAINRLGFFFGLEKRVLMYFYSNNILGYIPLPLLLTISAILLVAFCVYLPLRRVGTCLPAQETRTYFACPFTDRLSPAACIHPLGRSLPSRARAIHCHPCRTGLGQWTLHPCMCAGMNHGREKLIVSLAILCCIPADRKLGL